MKSKRRWAGNFAPPAALCIILIGVCHCSADQEEDLLSFVRASHRAARQTVQSFSADVTSEVTFPNRPKRFRRGTYWRTFDTVRIQIVGAWTEDYLLKGSEIRQVGKGSGSQFGQPRFVASRRAATEHLDMLDVWSRMLIDSPGPSGGHYDLDRFLEFATGSIGLSRERKDGRDYIRLTLTIVSNTGVRQNVTLWHDVARNCLVWKKTLNYEKTGDKFEAEVLEFTEPLPGLFFPSKCRRQALRRGGGLRSLEEITLTDIQVNEPIPKSVFQLPTIPAGTELFDKIQGTVYPIDGNWQPIGPARPYVVTRVPAKSDSLESGYHSQSRSEARSFSWWFVSGSLGVIAAALFCRIYRQLRSRSSLHAG